MIKEKLHIYSRVSTVVQEEEGTSLENQQNLGIKKSKELDMDFQIWNEGGQSSFKDDLDNRPQLKELLNQVDEGLIKNLFVYNTDRLSRNQRTWGFIRWKLQSNKVVLFTPSGKIDLSNPMDDLLMGMLSEISSYDNKIRSDRSRQGKFQKVQQGFWRGGPTPFGYKNVEKRLVLDDYESEWVKKIFNSYNQGISIDHIRRDLNKNGVITRRGNPYWSLGSIRVILKNTTYIGYYNYHDKKIGETVRVETPELIDPIIFHNVQKKMEFVNERKHQTNRTSHFYLLRDVLVCGHCGSRMSGRKDSKNNNHYYCPKKERSWVTDPLQDNEKWVRGNRCSMTKSLNIDLVDKEVWRVVEDVVSESKILREEYRNEILPQIIKSREDKRTTKTNFKKKIKKVQRDISNLDLTISNFETDVLLKRHSGNPIIIRKNLKNEKIRLVELLESINQDYHSFLTEKGWIDWIKRYEQDIRDKEDLSDQERKDYISKIIEKIEVVFNPKRNRHTLEISFSLPIVNDSLVYKNDTDKREGWDVEEGKNVIRFDEVFNSRGRPKKKFTVQKS